MEWWSNEFTPKSQKNEKKENATKTPRHEDTQRIHNQYNCLCEFFESLGLSG